MTSLATDADAQPTSTALHKINSMGKFVGTKIADLSRKMKRQTVAQIQQPVVQFHLTGDSQTLSPFADLSDANESIAEPLPQPNPIDKSQSNLNGEFTGSESAYVPQLNQKNYPNKQSRIKHIERFASNSNTVFLII